MIIDCTDPVMAELTERVFRKSFMDACKSNGKNDEQSALSYEIAQAAMSALAEVWDVVADRQRKGSSSDENR